jgi:hypothetical protein
MTDTQQFGYSTALRRAGGCLGSGRIGRTNHRQGAYPPGTKAARRRARRPSRISWKNEIMTLSTILLIVIVLLLVGALPRWPYSASWGYAPSGTLGTLLLILIILLLLGVF